MTHSCDVSFAAWRRAQASETWEMVLRKSLEMYLDGADAFKC